jgi:HK97 family phage portal protein
VALLDFFRRRPVKMDPLELWREIYGGTASATGKTVNYRTALEVATVLACARVIAEGIAQVPLKLFLEESEGKARSPATDHPLYEVLYRRPNFFQTSFEYRETLALHAVLCGQHFSLKVRGRRGILELIPIEPQYVTVMRDPQTLELTYKLQPPQGDAKVFSAEQIWHVKGPSWNGYFGLEAVKLAREAIGLAMATEESHARLHKHGARVGGILSVEGTLAEGQYEQLRKWLEKHFEGSQNAHRTMILDRAAKFTSAQQTGVDSEHLATRRYQVEEICRAMRVMPIMVGMESKNATYASAEQMFLSHVVHTLAPWYQRIEQSIDVNLLTPQERAEGYYAKFIEEGLLRGSAKDTKDVLLGYVNGGLMTPNEGRAKLDLNPDSDPASDKLRIPANITGSVPEPDAAPAGSEADASGKPKS